MVSVPCTMTIAFSAPPGRRQHALAVGVLHVERIEQGNDFQLDGNRHARALETAGKWLSAKPSTPLSSL
jgi:hypothetical protein